MVFPICPLVVSNKANGVQKKLFAKGQQKRQNLVSRALDGCKKMREAGADGFPHCKA